MDFDGCLLNLSGEIFENRILTGNYKVAKAAMQPIYGGR